jgi:ribosomal-protein-alanine N-acetyltransferase
MTTMQTAAIGTTTPIEVSRVHFRDLSAVVQLERRCFGEEAWGWADFLLSLTPGNLFLKATRAGRLVGFILAQPNRRRGITWIANVAVDPTVRNLGIGRALMLAVEERVRTPRLKLTVRVDNDPARHLYRSLGYIDMALRRGYYAGRADGMEMEKII